VADAAIAGLICMGIVHSQSMGIGGGFLMILYNGTTKTARVSSYQGFTPSPTREFMRVLYNVDAKRKGNCSSLCH